MIVVMTVAVIVILMVIMTILTVCFEFAERIQCRLTFECYNRSDLVTTATKTLARMPYQILNE